MAVAHALRGTIVASMMALLQTGCDDATRFSQSTKLSALQGVSVVSIGAVKLDQLERLVPVPSDGFVITPDAMATIGGAVFKVALTRTVIMQIQHGTSVTMMRISDEPTFRSKAWVPVARSASWTFADDGLKTLYVTLSSEDGRERALVFDDVYVDAEAPIVEAALMRRVSGQGVGVVAIETTADDSGTGLAEMMWSADEVFADAEWIPFGSGRALGALSASRGAVYVKVRDYAGHESEPTVATLVKGGIARGYPANSPALRATVPARRSTK